MTWDTCFWEWRRFFRKPFPRIFFGKPKYLPPIVGTLSTTTVKKSGLGIQEPLTSANNKYLSLIHARSKLIGSVTGERLFSIDYQILALREEMCDGQKIQDDNNEPKTKGLVNYIEALDPRLSIGSKNIGYYMNVRGTTVTCTVLKAI